MGLESATYTDELVVTNPVAGDNVSQGDDHIRLLKSVIKATFPSLTRAIYFEQAAVDLASATTPDLGTPASNYINITGTTQIDGFASELAGFVRLLRFAGVLTLNYNATSHILLSGDDIVTAAGDHALYVSLGSGNWRMVAYYRASGRALIETTYTIDSLGGLSQGKHTIYLPAGAFYPAVTNGAVYDVSESASNKLNRARYAFSASAIAHLWAQIGFPKSWNGGTITAQFEWETAATDTDSVVWQIAGVTIADGESLDAALGTAITVTDAAQSSATEILISAETSAITLAGAGDGEKVFIRVTRDPAHASDTIGETCYLLGVKLFITIDDPDDT